MRESLERHCFHVVRAMAEGQVVPLLIDRAHQMLDSDPLAGPSVTG